MMSVASHLSRSEDLFSFVWFCGGLMAVRRNTWGSPSDIERARSWLTAANVDTSLVARFVLTQSRASGLASHISKRSCTVKGRHAIRYVILLKSDTRNRTNCFSWFQMSY